MSKKHKFSDFDISVFICAGIIFLLCIAFDILSLQRSQDVYSSSDINSAALAPFKTCSLMKNFSLTINSPNIKKEDILTKKYILKDLEDQYNDEISALKKMVKIKFPENNNFDIDSISLSNIKKDYNCQFDNYLIWLPPESR